jgi:hypothetical protein
VIVTSSSKATPESCNDRTRRRRSCDWPRNDERDEQRCPQPRGSTKESVFAMKKNAWRAVIEVAFIIFLFYSNLLMGEFERSVMGQKRGVEWAIGDVFTAANLQLPR